MTGGQAIVAGSGPAGLSAACLLAEAGIGVTVVAPPPDLNDPRTVALMRPSIDLLRNLGLWPGTLEGACAPLRRLRIVDDTGGVVTAPELNFSASEIGEEAFGWNVPLALLVPALHQRAMDLGARMLNARVTGLRVGTKGSTILTSDGELTAQVILAADGQNSVIREALGIKAAKWTYDQTAIATSFGHSAGHRDTSTEYHRPAGPFTTVPLPGNRSSLVWMERPARAADLIAMDDRQFAAEIQIATHGYLGRIDAIGPRRSFPMRGASVQEFTRDRTMLVGESAHLVPPIGAQGLNMSLRDAAHAAELVIDAVSIGEDPGAITVMRDYQAARRMDILPRQAIVDAMNRSLLSEFQAFSATRALGLAMVAATPPLRRMVMRRGLAPAMGLPRSMRS